MKLPSRDVIDLKEFKLPPWPHTPKTTRSVEWMPGSGFQDVVSSSKAGYKEPSRRVRRSSSYKGYNTGKQSALDLEAIGSNYPKIRIKQQIAKDRPNVEACTTNGTTANAQEIPNAARRVTSAAITIRITDKQSLQDTQMDEGLTMLRDEKGNEGHQESEYIGEALAEGSNDPSSLHEELSGPTKAACTSLGTHGQKLDTRRSKICHVADPKHETHSSSPLVKSKTSASSSNYTLLPLASSSMTKAAVGDHTKIERAYAPGTPELGMSTSHSVDHRYPLTAFSKLAIQSSTDVVKVAGHETEADGDEDNDEDEAKESDQSNSRASTSDSYIMLEETEAFHKNLPVVDDNSESILSKSEKAHHFPNQSPSSTSSALAPKYPTLSTGAYFVQAVHQLSSLIKPAQMLPRRKSHMMPSVSPRERTREEEANDEGVLQLSISPSLGRKMSKLPFQPPFRIVDEEEKD